MHSFVNKKPKIEAIIFDAFGTLTSDGVYIMGRQLAKDMGLSNIYEFWSKMPSWLKNWQRIWLGDMKEKEMETKIAPEVGKNIAYRYFAGWKKLTKVHPEMIALLRTIEDKGSYKLGLLTNSPPHY